MKLITDLSDIKNTLLKLGFDYVDGHYSSKVIILLATVLILTINSILDSVINWNDIDIQVDGLKGLFVYLFFGICLSSIVFNWRKTKTLIEIIEARFYEFPFHMTEERLKLEAEVESEMIFLQTVWYIGNPVYTFSEILPPILLLIFRLFTTNIQDLTVYMLFTTHRYYWPECYETLTVYFVFLILQTTLYFFIVNAGYVMISSAFISMYLVAGEMRLMALSIEEMDKVIKNHNTNRCVECITGRRNSTQREDSITMKLYQTYLIRHHQHIYRTAAQVNQGIQLVAFYLNSACALLMVTGIYVMIRRARLVGKLQEVVYCFFVLLTSYFYHIMGQEVLNQDENLRKALYRGEWEERPQWFKKSLQIMMTRANKAILMRPMGLFVLDLQNFQQLLKAIYTFYNLLTNIKGAEE